MADEATCIEAPRIIKRITVSNLVAIAKGTIMKLSGDYTGVASSGADVFAGIAVEEKTASDGITEIGVAIDGVWDIVDSGTGITLGAQVCLSGVNVIRAAVAGDLLTGLAFGKAMETATGAERIRVRIGHV